MLRKSLYTLTFLLLASVLYAASFALQDNTVDDCTIKLHGFVPKAPNDITKFLSGDCTWRIPPTSGGTVTSFSSGNLSPVFSTSVATSTTTPALSYSLSSQATNTIFAAPNGSTGAPTFRLLVGADIPAITESGLSLSNITTKNVTSTAHGFAPVSPADATKFLNGAATPAYALVKDSDLSTSDIATNDVSSSKHGFAPKGDGTTTKFLNANGAYSTPASGASTASIDFADITSQQSLVGHTAGNFTVGVQFRALQAIPLTGFKFSYDGFASKTVKWTVYNNGFTTSGSTVVQTSTVAVSTAGVYTVTLASPLTFIPGNYYTIAIYINDGSNYIKYTTMINPPWVSGTQSGVLLGSVYWVDIATFAAGDAKPTSGAGTDAAPIQLTF